MRWTSKATWRRPSAPAGWRGNIQAAGDSPLIGAGNYCDNRYGAAACTGMGELAIRASTARSLVLYLKFGMSLPRQAG